MAISLQSEQFCFIFIIHRHIFRRIIPYKLLRIICSYIFTYKSIISNCFCVLFTFFWNFQVLIIKIGISVGFIRGIYFVQIIFSTWCTINKKICIFLHIYFPSLMNYLYHFVTQYIFPYSWPFILFICCIICFLSKLSNTKIF